ncbi:hypothetical protein PSELUDRAFT_2588 [Vogesella sp. LIG4]|nr:hypothetical protein PSELUDRAFT_2588 [Vogesella sp. LIG4]
MQIGSQITPASPALGGSAQAKTTGNGGSFAATASASSTPANTVTPAASGGNRPLTEQEQALMLPTRENVGRMAADVQTRLQQKLAAAGISASPAFELVESDPNTGYITVRGDRPDAAAIEKLINGDDKLSLAIHNVNALASQIPSLEAGVAYTRAWYAARSDSERMAVFEYYRALQASLHTDTQMRFGPQGMAFSLNGEAIALPA